MGGVGPRRSRPVRRPRACGKPRRRLGGPLLSAHRVARLASRRGNRKDRTLLDRPRLRSAHDRGRAPGPLLRRRPCLPQSPRFGGRPAISLRPSFGDDARALSSPSRPTALLARRRSGRSVPGDRTSSPHRPLCEEPLSFGAKRHSDASGRNRDGARRRSRRKTHGGHSAADLSLGQRPRRTKRAHRTGNERRGWSLRNRTLHAGSHRNLVRKSRPSAKRSCRPKRAPRPRA